MVLCGSFRLHPAGPHGQRPDCQTLDEEPLPPGLAPRWGSMRGVSDMTRWEKASEETHNSVDRLDFLTGNVSVSVRAGGGGWGEGGQGGMSAQTVTG